MSALENWLHNCISLFKRKMWVVIPGVANTHSFSFCAASCAHYFVMSDLAH